MEARKANTKVLCLCNLYNPLWNLRKDYKSCKLFHVAFFKWWKTGFSSQDSFKSAVCGFDKNILTSVGGSHILFLVAVMRNACTDISVSSETNCLEPQKRKGGSSWWECSCFSSEILAKTFRFLWKGTGFPAKVCAFGEEGTVVKEVWWKFHTAAAEPQEKGAGTPNAWEELSSTRTMLYLH